MNPTAEIFYGVGSAFNRVTYLICVYKSFKSSPPKNVAVLWWSLLLDKDLLLPFNWLLKQLGVWIWGIESSSLLLNPMLTVCMWS